MRDNDVLIKCQVNMERKEEKGKSKKTKRIDDEPTNMFLSNGL
jgi:hypothetical protein